MTVRTQSIALILTAIALATVPLSVSAHNTFPSYEQDGYRFFDQDGIIGEDESGWGAGDTAENTNITGLAKNSPFLLRFDVSETANQDQGQTITWRLEYQEGSVACNAGGTWVQVTTSSTAFELVADTQSLYNNGDGMVVDRISTDAKNFTSGEGKHVETNTEPTGTLDNGSGESQWSIQATSNASDSTTYTFRVTDGGTALNTYTRCAQATIAAPASAPTVTTNAATNITENSATINGEITATGGENANERGFAWGITADLSGGDTATNTEFGDFGTGAFSDSLASLTPGGQYYFRAYAANTVGTSTGSILNFRTSIGQPRAILLGTFLLLSGTLIIF